jgi:hypothetical protein
MKIINNINYLLGDDLKASLQSKGKLKVAASCFSIYAYEALKSELAKIDSLEFIFTAPTSVPNEVTDKLRKERREFFIPTMELRAIEEKKIECARKFFEEINRRIDPEHVKYDVVTSYGKLMELVGKGGARV